MLDPSSSHAWQLHLPLSPPCAVLAVVVVVLSCVVVVMTSMVDCLVSPLSSSSSSHSSSSSPWSSSSDPLHCDFVLEPLLDLQQHHTIPPFTLSPAQPLSPSMSSSGPNNSTSSHAPLSPYLLSSSSHSAKSASSSSSFPIRVPATVPSSPSFSAFTAPHSLRAPQHSPHHFCQYSHSHSHPHSSPHHSPLGGAHMTSPPSSALSAHPSSHSLFMKQPLPQASHGPSAHFKAAPRVTHAITLTSSPVFLPSSPSFPYHHHHSSPHPHHTPHAATTSPSSSAFPSPSLTALPPPSLHHVHGPPRYLHLSPLTSSTTPPSSFTSTSLITSSAVHTSISRVSEQQQSGSGEGEAEAALCPPPHKKRKKAEVDGDVDAATAKRTAGQGKSNKPRPSLRISTSAASLSSTSSSSSPSHSPSSPSSSSHPPGFLSPTSSTVSCSSSLLVFACPSCPRRFSRNSNLTRHKRIHSNDRRFHCPHCSKGFMEKHHLTAHARTHTGEKPYKCPSCPRQFTDRSNCSRHIRTHGLSPVDTDDEDEEEREDEEQAEAEREQERGRVGEEHESGRGQVRVKPMRVRQVRIKQERPHPEAHPSSTSTPREAGNAIEESRQLHAEEEHRERLEGDDEAEQDGKVVMLSMTGSPPLSSLPVSQSPFPPPCDSSPPFPSPSDGRVHSLDPFTLHSIQSPLLGLSSPQSPSGRRPSYSSFSLSPAFTSSSPVLHLLSASHDLLSPPLPARPSPPLPSLPSLLPSIPLVSESLHSALTCSLSATPDTTPSSSLSETAADLHHTQQSNGEGRGDGVGSSSGGGGGGGRGGGADVEVGVCVSSTSDERLMDGVVAPSPRAHLAVTQLLLTAANEGVEEAITPRTASDHLHALYSKLIQQRHTTNTTVKQALD